MTLSSLAGAALHSPVAAAHRRLPATRPGRAPSAVSAISAISAAPRAVQALCVVLCSAVLAGCVVVPAQPRHAPRPAQRPYAPTEPVALPPMYFYPAQGQDEARQDRDRYECYRWAVRETGTDPGMTPVRQSAAPPPPQRDGAPVVVGAATGAVLGAATGSHRHAGPAIVLGAIFGATLGAASEQRRAEAAERAQARHEAAADAARRPLENFRRAMSACMVGRGYRVG